MDVAATNAIVPQDLFVTHQLIWFLVLKAPTAVLLPCQVNELFLLLLQQVTRNNVEGGVGMKAQESRVFIDLLWIR